MSFATPGFWRGRRVLLTGHTGFKGAWMGLRLRALGAEVTGLALDPPTVPSLFDLAGLASGLRDLRADLRDSGQVQAAVAEAKPEIVFHLAAQPLVRVGLEHPLDTLDVNIMGTARLFDALLAAEPKAVVSITSDKVYLNREAGSAFREDDRLGGADPYSGSKSAAEHVARIYRESFGLPVVTARAGNVVGGGDFAANRLVPDVLRAILAGSPLRLRRPTATRPWSYVLDIAEGYLLYAEALFAGQSGLPEALNFGPAPHAPEMNVLATATVFAVAMGVPLDWCPDGEPYPEKTELAIDSSLARTILGWRERFPGADGLTAAGQWYRAWHAGEDPRALSERLIRQYTAPLAVA